MGRQFISHGKLGKSGPVLKTNIGNCSSVANDTEYFNTPPLETPENQELSRSHKLWFSLCNFSMWVSKKNRINRNELFNSRWQRPVATLVSG